MKGIILAGDSGRKLFPLTLGIPKQLLPVYDQPMIYYSIESLARAGIMDILVITTSIHQQAFKNALADERFSNIRFTFAVQDTPNGIAESISIGKLFIGNDDVCLVTGDTIIYGDDFDAQVLKAIRSASKSANATIFVSSLHDPEQYGVVVYKEGGKCTSIMSKPSSSYYYSITGFYVFPNRVVNKIHDLEPSERGLLEITSLYELFHNDRKLQIQKLNSSCKWFSPNNYKELLDASFYFSKIKNN